ncbi:hypothetical protein [Marinomonas ostreistagni]|uniref:hypothetical protein n=1 Tax=Marinomonas ostreistagni TaxID=359209 RepID=UPI00194FBCE1|nr:hypothetical protein [Marinomonas ostreistagni]MBM6551851.1 hypothetical protein [Marinomonas ostreistagni]
MDIVQRSDEDIRVLAEAIWDDMIKGSNSKDWALFAKHMAAESVTDQARAMVEHQWQYSKLFTSLIEQPEYMGILRQTDHVLVLFKQLSSKAEGEYLAMLYLKTIDDEVKVVGSWIR